MKTITHTVQRGYFNGSVEKETLVTPEKVVWLLDPNEVGHWHYIKEPGFGHYLGAMYKKDFNEVLYDNLEFTSDPVEFGDLLLFSEDNIKPGPDFSTVTEAEFNSLFKFDEFYVKYQEKLSLPKGFLEENNSQMTFEELKERFEQVLGVLEKKQKTKGICKILKIHSAFRVDVLEVVNTNFLNQETFSIRQASYDLFQQILAIGGSRDKITVGRASKGSPIEKEFKDMINSVLEPVRLIVTGY